MSNPHQWMPNTLFDMAAFCEKHGLEKAGTILIETASLLYICLASQEPYMVEPDVPSAGSPDPDRGIGHKSGPEQMVSGHH